MTKPRWMWLERERRKFCELLAASGDPVVAAAAVERSVSEAYGMRVAVPEFAAAWDQAIGIAWDLVDSRVLAGLLRTAPMDDKSAAKASTLIDSRVALAVMRRREGPKAVRRVVGDSLKVAAVREEIRRLAQG